MDDLTKQWSGLTISQREGPKKYDGVSKIEDLDFNNTSFWIQLHGLPVKFMTMTVTETLCEPAEQILTLPNTKTEECGGFMRVQVMVDIS